MKPELKRLLTQAVTGEMSQAQATLLLSELWSRGGDVPELEQVLMRVAGDDGIAEALARLNEEAAARQAVMDGLLEFADSQLEQENVAPVISLELYRRGRLRQVGGPSALAQSGSLAMAMDEAIKETHKRWQIHADPLGATLILEIAGRAGGTIDLSFKNPPDHLKHAIVSLSQGPRNKKVTTLEHAGKLTLTAAKGSGLLEIRSGDTIWQLPINLRLLDED